MIKGSMEIDTNSIRLGFQNAIRLTAPITWSLPRRVDASSEPTEHSGTICPVVMITSEDYEKE